MGAGFSTSNALHIQFPKIDYFPGEILEGVVALNCIKPITTNGIHIEVLGSENTSFYTNEHDSTTGSTGSRHQYGYFDFLKVTLPLGPPGTLQPGQYQFGFKVTLPHALPPSCQVSRGGDSGRIVYRVKANIGKSMAFDIKAEAAFTVLPAPPMNVIPVNNAATQEMMQCCCFSKGQAYAQVSVAKDVAMAGENLQVTVQARNNTSSEIRGVNIYLKRYVRLRASPGRSYYNESWQEKVAGAVTPGLKVNEALEGPTARTIVLPLPPNLQPNIAGMLMDCNYMLELELKGGAGTSSLRTSVPLRTMPAVSATATQPIRQMEAPADWKPSQVFPTVEIAAPLAVQSPSSEGADVAEMTSPQSTQSSGIMMPPPSSLGPNGPYDVSQRINNAPPQHQQQQPLGGYDVQTAPVPGDGSKYPAPAW